MPVQVAVCGPADATPGEFAHAREVGRLVAERGAVVLCGGGSGVMAAAAAGARAAGGIAIGVRPGPDRVGTDPAGPDPAGPDPVGTDSAGTDPAGTDRADAAADLTAVIVTNMGEARNAVIVSSADAVVVVGGSWGTLSEVALALRRGGIPVVALGGWRVLDADGREVSGITHVDSAVAAVDVALGAEPDH